MRASSTCRAPYLSRCACHPFASPSRVLPASAEASVLPTAPPSLFWLPHAMKPTVAAPTDQGIGCPSRRRCSCYTEVLRPFPHREESRSTAADQTRIVGPLAACSTRDGPRCAGGAGGGRRRAPARATAASRSRRASADGWVEEQLKSANLPARPRPSSSYELKGRSTRARADNL